MIFCARPLARFGAMAWGAVLLLGVAGQVCAQATPPINGIYTCTDANGRKLRSDRPIAACIDREQTVLNPSGTVRAKVGPSLSAQQRAEQEAQWRAEEEQRAQALEDRRRDRAMLARYPARDAHDQERALAHTRVDTVVQEAGKRMEALRQERKKIDQELEFYQGDPNKAPAALQRQIDYVAQSMQAQRRFILTQEAERKRVDARFDEELVRLKELWQDQQRASGATPRAGVKP